MPRRAPPWISSPGVHGDVQYPALVVAAARVVVYGCHVARSAVRHVVSRVIEGRGRMVGAGELTNAENEL